MKQKILHRHTGAVLFECELPDGLLASDALGQATKLAIQQKTDLRSADLRYADLRSANLSSANLRSADLRCAVGVEAEWSTPLLMLTDQPKDSKLRAYKLVNSDFASPIHAMAIKYQIGKTVKAEADCNVNKQCGAGINVATLDWCLLNWQPGWRVLILEFRVKDIAAIPAATDGKFRLHRAKVVGEKKLDLVKLGLVKPETK